MKDHDKIELRSEKVRNIIGTIPSLLIRSGITLISIILVGLIIASAYIPYTQSLAVNAQVVVDKGDQTIRGISFVPYTYISKIQAGLPVQIELEGYHSHSFGTLEGRVSEIDKTVITDHGENFFQIHIFMENTADEKGIDLQDGMQGIGYILLSDDSILKHITSRIFN